MVKKNITGKEELKTTILEILGKDEVILKLVADAINSLSKRREEKYKDSAREIWQEALRKGGIKLAKNCRIDRIIDVLPLSFNEIKQVVQNIKTRKEPTPLNYEGLRNSALEVLGDNVLKTRKAVTLRRKQSLIQTQLKGKVKITELGQKQALEETLALLQCSHSYWCSFIGNYSKLIICPEEFSKICLEPHAVSQTCEEEHTCGDPYFCGLQFARGDPDIPEVDRCQGFFDPIVIR